MMRIAVLIISSLLIGGCSKYLPRFDEVIPDRTKEYRKSESLPDLEVPPDLTSEGIRDTMAVPDVDDTGVATYSSYQERVSARQEARRLEENPLSIQTLADEKLLIVEGQPSVAWNKLRSFWQQNGYSLDLDDQELGIMETTWKEDPQKLLRNRFKIFVEPGQDGLTTVLYVSHAGEEMLPVGEDLVWRKRARDHATEDAMLARINQSLGGAGSSPAVSRTSRSIEPGRTAPVRSSRELSSNDRPDIPVATAADNRSAEVLHAGGGKYYINVPEDFSHAWNSTKLALERTSLIVEEGDRDFGVFYVIYSENGEKKKSVWKKMAFWSDDTEGKYQVSLTGVGPKTEIVILNAEGKWDSSDIANSILKELSTQLNR